MNGRVVSHAYRPLRAFLQLGIELKLRNAFRAARSLRVFYLDLNNFISSDLITLILLNLLLGNETLLLKGGFLLLDYTPVFAAI